LRFQRIQNISGLSKDGRRPWWYGDDNADRNVENTCCAVHSLVDISSAVWAAQPLRGRLNPEKTARLLAALKAAVPFKVELVPSLVRSTHAMGERHP
jgi:hypothetical protein